MSGRIEGYLGLDTSCYTTSAAIMDGRGQLLAEARRLLQVKSGGLGLAQSEMVFQHTRNLPVVFEEALGLLAKPVQFRKIGVSAVPRSLPDSYMPAFLVGESCARILARVYQIPLLRISHQENHILAGIWSAGGPIAPEFLAVHVSGGTTDIVRVVRGDPSVIQPLGGSLDLQAGQFIDRVGVALRLSFPAGSSLEALAVAGHERMIRLPVSVRGMNVSFSGPATKALRMIEQGVEPAAIAAGVEECIAVTVAAMTAAAVRQTSLTQVLLVGGVMSNRFIRARIVEQLVKEQVQLFFPQPQYSADNAVGAAYYAVSYNQAVAGS